jgi:hypothetical protein
LISFWLTFSCFSCCFTLFRVSLSLYVCVLSVFFFFSF